MEEVNFTSDPLHCRICLASTNFSCKTNKSEQRGNANETATTLWIASERTTKEMIPSTVCEIGRPLGSGGFGTVYEASLEGKKLAVKKNAPKRQKSSCSLRKCPSRETGSAFATSEHCANSCRFRARKPARCLDSYGVCRSPDFAFYY